MSVDRISIDDRASGSLVAKDVGGGKSFFKFKANCVVWLDFHAQVR